MKRFFIYNIHNLSLVNNIFLLLFIYIFLSVIMPGQGQGQGQGPCQGEGMEVAVGVGGVTLPAGGSCPAVDTGSGAGEGQCGGAFEHAVNKVCNESTWSQVTKAASAFTASQSSGDIKAACDAAKTLNSVAGLVNTEFMTSCGSALGVCISKCEVDKDAKKLKLDAANKAVAAGDLTASASVERLTVEIADIESKIKTCTNKKTNNKWAGTTQILQNAQAVQASDKCSKDTSADESDSATSTACSDFPQSLQAICHENGPTQACELYPSLPLCQRLRAEEANNKNKNIDLDPDPLNPDTSLEDGFGLSGCLENPSSPGCQSTFCSSLPTSPMRDVCNTDGVQAFCENLPSLPQCKGMAANIGSCSKLSNENLAEECQASGTGTFCERHSQLTFCKNLKNGDNEFSELAQQELGGADAAGVDADAGVGAGGGGFGFGGGGGAGSGSGSAFDDLEDGIGGDGVKLTPEEIKAGINTGGGASGGRYAGKRSRFNPGKFNPSIDFKSLFGKKKKKDQKRGVSSVGSREISSANGLTNFQKVSRAMKARYPIFFKNKNKQANRAL